MSSGGRDHTPDPAPEIGGIEDETLASSQEAVPVPVVIGTHKLAARWLSPIYNPRAVQKEEKAK